MTLDIFFGTKAPPQPVLCSRCGSKIPPTATTYRFIERGREYLLCKECGHNKLKPKTVESTTRTCDEECIRFRRGNCETKNAEKLCDKPVDFNREW